MGCLAIGSNFIGAGRDHWLKMLESPRENVAQWYPLLESIPGVLEETSPVRPVSLSCLNGRSATTSQCLSMNGNLTRGNLFIPVNQNIDAV